MNQNSKVETKSDMTSEQKQILAECAGLIIGQIIYYRVMRKLGAPKYVAYFAQNISAHLVDMKDPLKPRIEKAFKNGS